MNLHMHARGCEKMKIEIEEKDWVKCDNHKSLEIEYFKPSKDFIDFELVKLQYERFPEKWKKISEGNVIEVPHNDGYFYSIGYIPCYSPKNERVFPDTVGFDRRVIFRTKSIDLRDLILKYSEGIKNLIGEK